MKLIWSLAAVVVLAGPAAAEPRFAYDLGAATLDVSSYPKEQQAAYAVFAQTCSQCHTLARPINSPIVREADWRRFIRRMHLRTASTKAVITPEQAKTILSFLAYDSKVRKVDHQAEFAAETKRLEDSYKGYLEERKKLQLSEDKQKAKARGGSDVGTPQPQ